MANLATHEAEQDAMTAACENGTCDHPDCKMGAAELAQTILDNEPDEDDNVRRAARAFLTYSPVYDDTAEAALSDLLTDVLHLCDLAGWDFSGIERRARASYITERHDLGVARYPSLSRAINDA